MRPAGLIAATAVVLALAADGLRPGASTRGWSFSLDTASELAARKLVDRSSNGLAASLTDPRFALLDFGSLVPDGAQAEAASSDLAAQQVLLALETAEPAFEGLYDEGFFGASSLRQGEITDFELGDDLQRPGLKSRRFVKLTPEPLWPLARQSEGHHQEVRRDSELDCLALTVYFEARGEPDLGKLAVAHVVMNRVSDRRFPNSICNVVRQGGEATRYRCQFTWWCDGLSDTPRNRRLWEVSKTMARTVYWGESPDPTKGALWYHADYVAPSWSRVYHRTSQIGRHIFYQATQARAGLQDRDS